MIEPLVWRFLEYKQRKLAVIILTLLTGLAVVWPAADEYRATGKRLREKRDELAEAKDEVARLADFAKIFERRQAALHRLEGQMTGEVEAQRLRNDVVQLVRRTGCTMRRIRLGEPVRRDWMQNDDPIDGTLLGDRGAETPFRLVSRQFSVSITGPMASIHSFLAQLDQVDKLMHTKAVSLRRSEQEETGAALDIDLVLFDLVPKAEAG